LTTALLVQELTKRAEDMGINWGLEVINRYESNVCNTGLRVKPTASAARLMPSPALIDRVQCWPRSLAKDSSRMAYESI